MNDGLFGGTLPIGLDAQIKEVEREIELRRRVYPRWIEGGRLSQAKADSQIDVMVAVLKTVTEVRNQKNRC
jgi:hypothetical protein